MGDEALRGWRADGFQVVRGIYDPTQVARLRDIAERVLLQWRVRDAVSGDPGHEDGRVLRHPNHPAYHRDRPEDLRDLLELSAAPRALAVPRALLGEEPFFRCLSVWFQPLRTSLDGEWHRDTQFLHPEAADERREFDRQIANDRPSAGQFQIALVANDDVEVVPGSHRRWDTDAQSAIRRGGDDACRSNAMPGAVRVHLEPGDGVIFDPTMLHRGRYHTDKPRRTFMLTTTRLDERLDDEFSRQPWFLDPGYLDGLSPSARAFYERFVAVCAPKWCARATTR